MSKNKSILLLGGSAHQVPAIEAAKRLGYRTVLCDYLPDNPGQFVADVFYQESTVDRQKMLQIATDEQVSGVLAFGTDVAAPTAAYVAEQLGLPGNPLSSVEVLSNKSLFRPYLAKHGFNCPKAVFFPKESTVGEAMSLCEGMAFPVIMKPTDSSGSRGVTVIDSMDPGLFEGALDFAREFSREGTLVLEEYITNTFPHVIGGDVFVVDGEVRFWGLMSCLRDNEVAPLVPVGEFSPSGLSPLQEQEVKQEIQGLVASLGMRFGEMNVEVIIGEGNKPYIIELGARAGGNMIPPELGDVSGIDLVEQLVLMTMGEEPCDLSFDGHGKLVATQVAYARRSGVFKEVKYSKNAAPHIYREFINVSPGDRVERLTYGSRALGVVFLSFDSEEEMKDVLRDAARTIDVVVE